MRLLIGGLLLLAVAHSSAIFTGLFETQGGSKCKWEERVLDGQQRALGISCQCQGADGKEVDYTCEYAGNPHDCSMFTVQGGAERFYHQLAYFFRGTNGRQGIKLTTARNYSI